MFKERYCWIFIDSVMQGKKYRAATKIPEIFQEILSWCYLSHHVQLFSDDLIQGIFKVLTIRVFYAFYLLPYFNYSSCRQSNNISEVIRIEVMTQKNSSRTTKTVWKLYQILHIHLNGNYEMRKIKHKKYTMLWISGFNNILSEHCPFKNVFHYYNEHITMKTINVIDKILNY
jgi:hypothetical protein